MSNIEIRTWFDYLPIEIIFTIFDYLSSNDIIYTFFFFNQRLNNILLENQRYLNYLELPTTNLNTWKNILSIINSKIECLNINTFDLSLFSLEYFSNLKSIIINSSHGYPDEELNLIFENDLYNNLNTVKIRINKILSCPGHFYRCTNDNFIIKIFNTKNSIKIFEYSFRISSMEYICQNINTINSNLHSLTLIFTNFLDIFRLISYTPNLKYLNVQSPSPSTRSYTDNKPIEKTNIKLQEFYLTLNGKYDGQFNSDVLINSIKQFRSSLICLSINLNSFKINSSENFPCNSLYLQEFLESMIQLKQFHLYVRLNKYDDILSRFKSQYWFDHNWMFGMHENYFYTLPFRFNYLHDYSNHIKSNNPEILINNSRLWYNVKSINISTESKFDLNFIKELKIKTPKLNFIKFNRMKYIDLKKDEQIKLLNVTTIEFEDQFLENDKWFIYALPNLKHFILYDVELLLTDNELIEILNKKIQKLDIVSHYQLEHLIEKCCVYFSNVQYINCYVNYGWQKPKEYARIIMDLLIKFKNLKTLLIYVDENTVCDMDCCMYTNLNELIQCLNIKKIGKCYQVKYYREYLLFSKRECIENRIESGIVSSISKIFSFLH